MACIARKTGETCEGRIQKTLQKIERNDLGRSYRERPAGRYAFLRRTQKLGFRCMRKPQSESIPRLSKRSNPWKFIMRLQFYQYSHSETSKCLPSAASVGNQRDPLRPISLSDPASPVTKLLDHYDVRRMILQPALRLCDVKTQLLSSYDKNFSSTRRIFVSSVLLQASSSCRCPEFSDWGGPARLLQH